MSLKELGQNIIRLRKEKGISQERLTLDSDTSVSYLRAIEHGDANPTFNVLDRLSTALEIPFCHIFTPPGQNTGHRD